MSERQPSGKRKTPEKIFFEEIENPHGRELRSMGKEAIEAFRNFLKGNYPGDGEKDDPRFKNGGVLLPDCVAFHKKGGGKTETGGV